MKKVILICFAIACLSISISDTCLGQRSNRRDNQGRERGRTDAAPKVGDKAPDFKLKSLDGKSETQLSKFKGEKPVILFFGSYT